MDKESNSTSTGKARKVRKQENRKLTAKQLAFVNAMLSGSNATEAYRKAYNAGNMADSTISRSAFELKNHPKISAMLEKRVVEVDAQVVKEASSLRLFVLEGLQREASDSDSPSARVSALVALGKASGVFQDTEAEDRKRSTMTKDQLLSELQARLGAMFPDSVIEELETTAIDVTPNSVTNNSSEVTLNGVTENSVIEVQTVSDANDDADFVLLTSDDTEKS